MRRLTIIFAALLIGSMCFAQKIITNSEMLKTTLLQNSAERSVLWWGEQWGGDVTAITSNHQVIIRSERFTHGTSGNTITKVKFITVDPNNADTASYATYTNMNFTIKIYEGGTFDSDLLLHGSVLYDASILGTEVYSQNYTQTTYGENEVILATPYTINTNNYWISIVCYGNTLFACRQTPAGNSMSIADWNALVDISALHISHNYLYSKTIDEQEYLSTNLVTRFDDESQTTVTGFNTEYCLAYCIENGVASSDVYANFLSDSIEPHEYYILAPETMTIEATENLDLYPIIGNDGPDAVTDTVNISLTFNGVEFLPGASLPFSSENTLASGQFSFVNYPSVVSVTAAELDEAGLFGTFDVCLTATYEGHDNNSSNNSIWIAITRNPVSVEENLGSAVSVYPNPANDMITVANAEGETVVVMNALGQVVANIENADANQVISTETLAAGTYFVKVNAEVVKLNIVK